MDANEMKEMACAMQKHAAQCQEAERAVLRHVAEGELTPEEGAVCLAGAWLKLWEAIGRRSDHGVLLRQARGAIDSQQPGFEGFSLERHWRAERS